ncbi:hypothetical protein PBS_12650 [Paraburkholderia sp. 2C]|jgi:hypothetical protein
MTSSAARDAQLPRAPGCNDCFGARVNAAGAERDAAMECAACIAEVTDAYAASQLSLKLHDTVKTFYPS